MIVRKCRTTAGTRPRPIPGQPVQKGDCAGYQESLASRTLIYTTLTHGLNRWLFIGDRDAFDAAVTATPPLARAPS